MFLYGGRDREGVRAGEREAGRERDTHTHTHTHTQGKGEGSREEKRESWKETCMVQTSVCGHIPHPELAIQTS